MDVIHSLPPCPVAIHDDSIAFFGETFLPGEFSRGQEQFADQFGVLTLNIIDGPDRFLGDDQDVSWGLGVDVAKSEHLIGFEHDVGRDFTVDDFDEQIVGHVEFLGIWIPVSMGQSVAGPQESGGQAGH